MSVRQAQAQIDSAEFVDWMAFYSIEPWGADIEDLRTGSITQLMANINRDSKKKPEPFGILDHVPWAEVNRNKVANEPIFLSDPAEQTALMRASLFGKSGAESVDNDS